MSRQINKTVVFALREVTYGVTPGAASATEPSNAASNHPQRSQRPEPEEMRLMLDSVSLLRRNCERTATQYQIGRAHV